MQRDMERDVVGAWRQGSLPAAQGYVRARQSEALTVAYLLTLNRDAARGLAVAAFLRHMQAAHTLGPDADLRIQLLAQIGRSFLRKEFDPVSSTQPAMFADPRPQKFGVESQRDRTLAALGRLEERERVALVLGEVAGFTPADLNQVLERGNSALVAPVETARQRLRHSLDIPTSHPVRPALLEAGFDGPRDELWPLLEEPLTDMQQRQQRRSQALTWGVAGAAILAVVVLAAILFGGDLLSGGSDGVDASVEATAIPIPDNEIEIGSSALPSSTPEPTPTPLPVGDVPDTLLVQSYHDQNTTNPYIQLSLYEPEIGVLQPIEGEWSALAPNALLLSPDGSQVVRLAGQRSEIDMRFVVQAFDSRTFALLWQADVGAFLLGFSNQPDAHMAMAISGDRVYVAELDRTAPEAVRLQALDLTNGSTRETGSITIDVDPGTFNLVYQGSVSLYTAPDESRLLLALTGFDYATMGGVERTLIQSVDLPDLTASGEPVMTPPDINRTFWFGNERITPDGRALYSLSMPEWPATVTFVDLDSGEVSEVELPFPGPHDTPYPTITTLTSNDGRRLYAIDQVTGNVAIVNLVERRLERYFPIDTGAFSRQFGVEQGQYVFGWSSMLSIDGTRLYVSALAGNPSMQMNVYADSGVWVIDLDEWRIVDFWPVTGAVTNVQPGRQGHSLLVQHSYYDTDPEIVDFRFSHLSVTDGSVRQELLEPLPNEEDVGYGALSLVDLYRRQYGRTPSIDGVQPADLDTSTTLPRVEVTSDRYVASETLTSIEVRILDPARGGVLDGLREGVRFDPGSTVTAFLNAEGQPEQIIVLARVSGGVYRGGVTLPTAQTWTVDLGITARDGSTTRYRQAGRIDVAPTFMGSDGERYQLRVSTRPGRPGVHQTATVRLRLINVRDGTPIPEGVDLNVLQPAFDGASIDALPERLEVRVSSPGPDPVSRTALLYQVSPGHYEGTFTFRQAGDWTTTIRFRTEEGLRIDIPGGSISVAGG